ncbi:MAG: hypothetical protein WBM90_14090 [Acidimicrobiia bacterium]
MGTIVEQSLDPLSVRYEGGETYLIIEATDDAELYGAMSQMERLGLSIMGFRRIDSGDDRVTPGIDESE